MFERRTTGLVKPGEIKVQYVPVPVDEQKHRHRVRAAAEFQAGKTSEDWQILAGADGIPPDAAVGHLGLADGDAFMLIPYYRIPLILICSYYCIETSLIGALQFDGFVSYEGYSRGKIVFTTIEQFSVKWANGQYLVQTVFYKTIPTNLNCGAWLPSSQQFGTDGRDLYYLQEYDRKTNRNIIALIEPGIVPNSGPSPSISLLWHAYGSGLLLKDLDLKEIRSPRPDADPKQGRLNPTLVKIQYGMVKDNPLFLEHMEYLSDGHEYDQATKQI